MDLISIIRWAVCTGSGDEFEYTHLDAAQAAFKSLREGSSVVGTTITLVGVTPGVDAPNVIIDFYRSVE